MASSASRESRTRGSSSTTRTVAVSATSDRPRQRQAHGEDRPAAGRTGGRHLAAVLLHDLVADRQAEPGAFAHGLGGEERIEDAAEDLGRNSGPRVGDGDNSGPVLLPRLDRDLAL